MKNAGRKRGELLVGNVIFIILNLVFLTVLVIFILRQGGGIISLEQSYAKQIALIIDSAEPGMKIMIDLEQAKKANKEWFTNNYQNSVVIDNNLVTIKLSDDSSYSYSFFNDIKVSYDIYPEGKLHLNINEK